MGGLIGSAFPFSFFFFQAYLIGPYILPLWAVGCKQNFVSFYSWLSGRKKQKGIHSPLSRRIGGQLGVEEAVSISTVHM